MRVGEPRLAICWQKATMTVSTNHKIGAFVPRKDNMAARLEYFERCASGMSEAELRATSCLGALAPLYRYAVESALGRYASRTRRQAHAGE